MREDDKIRQEESDTFKYSQLSSEHNPPGTNTSTRPQHPASTPWIKLQEFARLAIVWQQVTFRDLGSSNTTPTSKPGNLNHHLVTPLSTYHGKNPRVATKQVACRVEVRDDTGVVRKAIQCASHNYAGLYGLDLHLHHQALDSLPVMSSATTTPLETAMNKAVMDILGVDFCVPTSTGYGANLLAFPAVIKQDWLVVLDEKSHNSMFVGVFQSRPGLVRKFKHNDMESLRAVLQEDNGKVAGTLVAVEGYYSMDGCLPDLAGLAKLKEQYKFVLLADEAHSLLSLGLTGKGCVEHWNETYPSQLVPTDLCDVRTATLSKAIGAVGGIVCGKKEFEEDILRRQKELLEAGREPLTVATCIQTVHVLSQPTLVLCNLRRLRAISRFCRTYLRKAGVYVYGDDDSHVLPVYTGRCSSAAKLSFLLLKAGVLAAPLTTPAVPFWEARVRVCLSAALDDDTVNELVKAIVSSVKTLGLCDDRFQTHEDFQFHCDDQDSLEKQLIEKIASTDRLRPLITQCATNLTDPNPAPNITDYAHRALDTYGLGSGGSRWIAGTTGLHTQAERLIAERLGQQTALTYPDSYIGLSSTIAALCRPTVGFKTDALLVPEKALPAIEDGITVAPKQGRPTIIRYTDMANLVGKVREQQSSCYTTIVLSSNEVGDYPFLRDLLRRLGDSRTSRTTLLVHDEKGIGSFMRGDPTPQCVSKARLLIYGAFVTAYNLPGSYLAGNAALIKELRYSSRGYMFTTSQFPFVMGMIVAELDKNT
ncbi:hypothetical protein NX059_006995 [Plenodomus lindquistii]|nr:hypothetical protein NX059_006995 [Plenodomus lindquistii]